GASRRHEAGAAARRLGVRRAGVGVARVPARARHPRRAHPSRAERRRRRRLRQGDADAAERAGAAPRRGSTRAGERSRHTAPGRAGPSGRGRPRGDRPGGGVAPSPRRHAGDLPRPRRPRRPARAVRRRGRARHALPVGSVGDGPERGRDRRAAPRVHHRGRGRARADRGRGQRLPGRAGRSGGAAGRAAQARRRRGASGAGGAGVAADRRALHTRCLGRRGDGCVRHPGRVPVSTVFASAADARYGDWLLNLVGSVKRRSDLFDRVVAFDLGLNPFQRRLLAAVPGVEIRNVPAFVPHWRQGFTWKPWAFCQLDADRVVWIDAGATVLRPLTPFLDSIDRYGYFVVSQDVPLHEIVPRDYYALYGVPESIGERTTVAAGIIGFRRESDFFARVVEPTYRDALEGRTLGWSAAE